MCDPVTATIAVAAGSGIQAYGAIQDGKNAKAAAFANAQEAEKQALDSLDRGGQEEARYRREIAQLIGSQRATFGARNVAADSGTALDLLSDSAYWGEMDAQQIRRNAGREAASLRTQAGEMRRQGRAAKRAGFLKAGASLLTGGAEAYGTWKSA